MSCIRQLLLFLYTIKLVDGQAWFSSLPLEEIGTDLLGIVNSVRDSIECSIWCWQRAECQTYKTEQVSKHIVTCHWSQALTNVEWRLTSGGRSGSQNFGWASKLPGLTGSRTGWVLVTITATPAWAFVWLHELTSTLLQPVRLSVIALTLWNSRPKTFTITSPKVLPVSVIEGCFDMLRARVNLGASNAEIN